MQRIARANYKIMRWQNGLGETAEIDRVPGGNEPFLWRFSQASIQTDVPFSEFPGYDRWLTVWKGGPIFLNDRKVEALESVRFSGDDKILCRLGGAPVLDVGLIFNRAKMDANVTVVEGLVRLSQPGVHYIFDLQSGDTIKFEQESELLARRSLLVSVWEIG